MSSKEKLTFWVDIMSKIAIPSVLAYLAFMQNSANQEFQETQKSIERQLELFKISWQSLTEEDQKKKEIAIHLLNYLEEDYARIVAEAYANDSTQPEQLRNEATYFCPLPLCCHRFKVESGVLFFAVRGLIVDGTVRPDKVIRVPPVL